jgi:four helix bundle protein
MTGAMTIQSYRDLDVWQKAIDLTDMIYAITNHFPHNELYGLTSQMRRSAVSIASNIAEGSARSGTKELIQFLYIARGSLAELETQLVIAERRAYCPNEISSVFNMTTSIGKMLTRLIQSLQRNAAA